MSMDEAIQFWRSEGYDVQLACVDSSGAGTPMTPEDFLLATMNWRGAPDIPWRKEK